MGSEAPASIDRVIRVRCVSKSDTRRSTMHDATIELAQVDEKSSAMKSSIGPSKRSWMSSGIAVVLARGTDEHRRVHRPREARARAVTKRRNHKIHRCRSRHCTSPLPETRAARHITELSEWDTSA